MSKAKILYIDDDAIQRQIIFHVLDQHGFEVETAIDGQVGVKLAQDWLPDLILMDLMMPVMDGFQAAEALRAHPDTQHIPIIAYSARDDDDMPARVQAVEMNGFLIKTISSQELLESLATYLPGPE
jgi:CheY-like chemotaxis protein